MREIREKSYYDIIAGLSAFECSHKVTLSPEELKDLTNKTRENENNDDEEKNKSQKNASTKRPIVHSYLGNKINLKEANYDLSHCVMGGFLPKNQLESLSSKDFAYYFHKSLECEDALEVYDLLVGNEYRVLRTPEKKNVRKALLCKNCKSKFYGSTRMQQLEKHKCINK